MGIHHVARCGQRTGTRSHYYTMSRPNRTSIGSDGIRRWQRRRWSWSRRRSGISRRSSCHTDANDGGLHIYRICTSSRKPGAIQRSLCNRTPPFRHRKRAPKNTVARGRWWRREHCFHHGFRVSYRTQRARCDRKRSRTFGRNEELPAMAATRSRTGDTGKTWRISDAGRRAD